jgi:hypothetical protein
VYVIQKADCTAGRQKGANVRSWKWTVSKDPFPRSYNSVVHPAWQTCELHVTCKSVVHLSCTARAAWHVEKQNASDQKTCVYTMVFFDQTMVLFCSDNDSIRHCSNDKSITRYLIRIGIIIFFSQHFDHFSTFSCHFHHIYHTVILRIRV